jgi:hypothetical protein
LGADQKNCRQSQVEVRPNQGGRGKKHNSHFKYFRPDRDRTLAEAVSEVSAYQRKENEGGGEEHADEQFHLIPLRFVFLDGEDQVNGKKFECVFVEGALELRGDEAPKAELPLFFWRRYGESFVNRHARSPGIAIRTQEKHSV